MSKVRKTTVTRRPDELFERVVRILEQARGNVVRSVNSSMVLAYWLIGREIVEGIQAGEGRAGYGEKAIEALSVRLTKRYGGGYSKPVLWSFRQFYLTYPDRVRSPSPAGRELVPVPIRHPAGGELDRARQ